MKKLIITLIFVSLVLFVFGKTSTLATWTTSTETVNGQEYFIAYTSTAVDTSDLVVYTEPTDFKLNWNAPIMIIVNPDGATIGNTALPVTMYCGYSDDFNVVVDSAGTATITDGWLFGNIETDVYASAGQTMLYGFPNTLADDTDDFYFIAPCPELVFEIQDATSFLAASTLEIIIMQPRDIDIPRDWEKSYK